MAIAFNLPSEREATEENFSRLNRLLAELYEVLCHILVARQPRDTDGEERRERPFSDSDVDRIPTLEAPPRRISTSHLPLLNFDYTDLDDDVFVSPRTDNGNDLFSNPHNMEIFGSPLGTPRTPAGVLLSPRRERRFTFEKHWKDKGGTDEADGTLRARNQEKEAESANSSKSEDANRASTSSEKSLLSSILPDKVSGSICTAALFLLGWKFFSNKR